MLMLEQCHERCKRILGEEHLSTINTLGTIGTIHIEKGEYDRALPMFEDCLAKSS
jgi:hypothetical protein